MHQNTLFKTYDGNQTIAYNWLEAMNTRVDIVICNVLEVEFLRLIEAIKNKIMQLHFIANRFDPYSELSRLNRVGGCNEVQLSDVLYSIIKQALSYTEPTFGCFDITIQSVSHSQNTYQNVQLNDADSSVCFLEKDIVLDLNGFVKGCALDWIAAFLRDNGVADAMVNLGNSSILAIGNQPNGEGWQIAMNPENGNTQQAVKLFDQCFTSSGNLTDSHSHIIHPRTGKPIENKKTVSVVTQSGAEGEALSTAFFVANDEQKAKIEKQFGVRCL